MVKMNGALRAPPLTAPPGLALRSSRRGNNKCELPPTKREKYLNTPPKGVLFFSGVNPFFLPPRLLNGKRILIPRNAVIAFLESCH